MKKRWTVSLMWIIEIVVLISFVNSLENISLDSPQNVIVGEVFEINLTLTDFSLNNYDVKIEILNGTTNLAQRLYENEWKSTNYWMYNAINTSKVNNSLFKLNITKDYSGLTNLSVMIRQNGKTNNILIKDYLLNISLINKSQDNSNNSSNNTNNPNNNSSAQNSEIELKMSWTEDDIINGKEFKIDISAYNLENEKYDVKVWIEFEDNNTVISDRYGKDSGGENIWKSGSYYVYDFFEGPGDKNDEVSLKIRGDYDDFHGDAKIFFKLNSGEEISESIEILEKENKKSESLLETNSISVTGSAISTESSAENIGAIRLGSEAQQIKTEDLKEENSIIYESKSELMKRYSIYGFALFCLILCILLVFEKIK